MNYSQQINFTGYKRKIEAVGASLFSLIRIVFFYSKEEYISSDLQVMATNKKMKMDPTASKTFALSEKCDVRCLYPTDEKEGYITLLR